jgi:hypothetical protein
MRTVTKILSKDLVLCIPSNASKNRQAMHAIGLLQYSEKHNKLAQKRGNVNVPSDAIWIITLLVLAFRLFAGRPVRTCPNRS